MCANTAKSKRAKLPIALLWITALVGGCTLQSAYAAVTVDQSPLTAQQSLPPNIVLTLDDSGSMAFDVMPDYAYLSSTSTDALVSSDVNGVYYNPTITYDAPYTANGVTRYTAYAFTSAPPDGFSPTSPAAVNLNSYAGGGNESSGGSTNPIFTNAFTVMDSTLLSCASGYVVNDSSSTNAGKCLKFDVQTANSGNGAGQPYCNNSNYNTLYNGNTTSVTCRRSNGNTSTSYLTCATSGYSVNTTYAGINPGMCVKGPSTQSSNSGNPTCPSPYSVTNSGKTSVSCQQSTSLFTYTVKSGSSYTRHYVGDSGKCALITSSNSSPQVDASVCHDDSATRQSVANWFSYYHTRILMAKSGLMNAFASLDPTIRFGFGTINGSSGHKYNNNYLNLPSSSTTYGYSDAINGGTNYVVQVQPLGDGSSGTQKAKFWTWLVATDVGGGTPLRQALNGVGLYYTSDQPWQTSSSDTTQLACRQSYSILTTDGFANGPDPSGIGDADGTSGPSITGPNNESYSYSVVPPYADGSATTTTYGADPICPSGYSGSGTGSSATCKKSGKSNKSPTGYSCDSGDSLSGYTCTKVSAPAYTNTLSDVAMKYWKTDLRTGMVNEVPTSTEDPAFWQHMTTFTVGLGFTPKYSDDTTPIPVGDVFSWANGGNSISGFQWPQPDYGNKAGSGGTLSNIADLAHAAVNGHGGFYSATSPEAFSNGIADALKRVNERIGSGASLAANSTKLDTGTTTYQAVYYTGKWKGDLKAFSVNPSTGAISTTPTWVASSQLPVATSRAVKTCNPCSGTGKTFVSFAANTTTTAAPAGLSSEQKAALGSSAAAQNSIISYLLGSASNEQRNNGSYRNRDTALGDIINSQPVYVGAPDANLFFGKSFTGSGDYATFAATNVARSARIWVAANDGMLHSFNASTGAEVFAFLPDSVIRSGVKNLSDPNYGGTSQPHQYYNDGEVTVADVYYSSAWHTVLVGTTGRGPSKAVYAIDVTDAAAPAFLWERSVVAGGSGSADIGQIVGKPVIAQTSDGNWSVLIGNGYNSTNGTSALLQFAIASGDITVRTTNATTNNGLASPAVWMDSTTNGISTQAYAGDLSGKVWKFDLSGTTGTSLFTAKDTDGNVQSITAGMLAGKDPKTGNLWLFFGTGQYLTQSDLANKDIQSWYGIIVRSDNTSLVTNLSSGRSALVERDILAEQAATDSTLAARAISTATAGDTVNKSGWYIDLKLQGGAAKGERMVTPNQFQGSLLLGTTRVPESSDPCNPSGSGWIMAIDPFTGGAPGDTFFDLNNDGQFNNSDKITVGGTTYIVAGVGFSSVPNNPIFVGNDMLVSFDNANTGNVGTKGTLGTVQRLSWREFVSQ